MGSESGGARRPDPNGFVVPMTDIEFLNLAIEQSPHIDRVVIEFRAPQGKKFSSFGYRLLKNQLDKIFEKSTDIIDTTIKETAIFFNVNPRATETIEKLLQIKSLMNVD